MWDDTGWIQPGYWVGVQHFNMMPMRYFCHPIAAIPLGLFFVGIFYYALVRAIWLGHKKGWDA